MLLDSSTARMRSILVFFGVCFGTHIKVGVIPCVSPHHHLPTDNDNQEASTSTPSSSRGKGRGRGRGRGRGGRTTASHHPAPTSQSQQVLASLEAATLLVAQLMGAVRLQPSYVLPYIKVALASLSMEGIPQVQMHAAATVLAAFVSNAGAPERQQDVMGQFLSEFLRSITSGTHPRRTFLVDPEANVLVHLASALLVELVQVWWVYIHCCCLLALDNPLLVLPPFSQPHLFLFLSS